MLTTEDHMDVHGQQKPFGSQVVMVHAFNPSTWEAEEGGSL